MKEDDNVFARIGKMLGEVQTRHLDLNPGIINPPKLIDNKKWERDEQNSEALKIVAEVQPQIANALKEMAEGTQKAYANQKRANRVIICISILGVIVGIIAILIAKGII